MNPKYRRDDIYKVDLAKFRDEGNFVVDLDVDDELAKHFTIQAQIQFYRNRGFTIKVIDEEDLFLIYAEKIE